MKQQKPRRVAAHPPLLVASVLAIAGCGSATEQNATSDEAHGHSHEHGHEHGHDHHHGHRPDSLHAAVDQLDRIKQAVGAAILSGNADAADQPLHEVAEIIEAIPDIAAETDLPKADWEAVNAAADRLFKAYQVIHNEFHRKEENQVAKQSAYEQVSGELTEALEEIRSRLALTGEQVAAVEPESDHDHEHDDHDHKSDKHDHPREEDAAGS